MINKFNNQCITYSQMNMIFNARIYYRRLTTWTRAYIIGRYLGIGTEEELFSRFYLESLDFGDMIRIYYGRENSERQTHLLNDYTIGFRDLISAQLQGNEDAVNQNVNRLYENANARAAFLASINPYIDEEEWKYLLGTYLRYTLEEANTFISGNYEEDIKIFESLTALSNRMGDAFAEALFDYIATGSQSADSMPGQGTQCYTKDLVNAIYNIRMFWFELFTWIRGYMLSRYRGVGNANEIYDRLKQVPVEYVNALKEFFGENPATDALLVELNTYIELIDDLITAQMEGNDEAVKHITELLHQNSDDRAASVSSLNPFWNEAEWRNRLHNNLNLTLEQANTFFTKDYSRNFEIFSILLDLAENTSGYFAQGLISYLNQGQPETKTI